jgi:hypothetical protein
MTAPQINNGHVKKTAIIDGDIPQAPHAGHSSDKLACAKALAQAFAKRQGKGEAAAAAAALPVKAKQQRMGRPTREALVQVRCLAAGRLTLVGCVR